MPARRTPDALRLLSGAVLPTRKVAPALALEPPIWLDDVARAEWIRLVTATRRYDRWLTETDEPALTAFCTQWSVYVAAAKDVAARGPLVPGRSGADGGALVKNPAVQIMRDAQNALRGWVSQLGFSPDARGRVNLSEPHAGSDADSLLDGDFD